MYLYGQKQIRILSRRGVQAPNVSASTHTSKWRPMKWGRSVDRQETRRETRNKRDISLKIVFKITSWTPELPLGHVRPSPWTLRIKHFCKQLLRWKKISVKMSRFSEIIFVHATHLKIHIPRPFAWDSGRTEVVSWSRGEQRVHWRVIRANCLQLTVIKGCRHENNIIWRGSVSLLSQYLHQEEQSSLETVWLTGKEGEGKKTVTWRDGRNKYRERSACYNKGEIVLV